MNNIQLIKNKLRETFGDVPFPYHCGMNAAIAKDDWISDPEELKNITRSKDVKGKWWEIPADEFILCSLASCYFDANATEFYLPAYMNIVIEDTTYKNYNTLISWLTPGENNSEYDFYDHFQSKFTNISGSKRIMCREVLEYVRSHLEPNDTYSGKKIDQILAHEFWNK